MEAQLFEERLKRRESERDLEQRGWQPAPKAPPQQQKQQEPWWR